MMKVGEYGIGSGRRIHVMKVVKRGRRGSRSPGDGAVRIPKSRAPPTVSMNFGNVVVDVGRWSDAGRDPSMPRTQGSQA